MRPPYSEVREIPPTCIKAVVARCRACGGGAWWSRSASAIFPLIMPAISITRSISIDSDELMESFTRSSGPGGQHVNTTDSAVMLRFDIANSPNLPDAVKQRLVATAGSRMTRDGVLVLRSEGSRSQLLNRQEVRERLFALIRDATFIPKKRRPTKPTKASQTRRVDGKVKRSAVKAGRGRVQQ
jgi:ribosome-associated protein